MNQTWAEHESCARCGNTLGDNFSANHLGVRFCPACYTDAVEEREQQRRCEPVLEQLCNRCHGSLINGYRTNYMGVYFCVPCFERTHTPEGRPRIDWDERDTIGIAQQGGSTRDRMEPGSGLEGLEEDEGGTVYLHEVFFATTLLALVMYAMSKFGGAIFTVTGW